MSDLATYKASFKTANKYLKYFCDNPASDWSFKKYKKHFSDKDSKQIKKLFVQNLRTIKDDSKNIPKAVNQHIDELIKSCSPVTNSASDVPSTSTVNHIEVKGNYYNAGRDLTVNQTAERAVKKQKTSSKKKEEEIEVEFKQKWVDFLADAEQNKNFHKYSPEKNGVTRLGAKLSPHPSANKEIYRHLKQQLKPSEATDFLTEAKSYIDDIAAAADIEEFEENVEAKAVVEDQKKTCRLIKDICRIMGKVYTKRPSISLSEAVYNTNMIFPCLEAMLAMMKKSEHGPYFIPGEGELAAMTVQLKKMGCKKAEDKRKIYKADGIIRLAELGDLEVLVLETAGAFGHDDHAKASFDNSKGMFALLAMLKTVADHYKYASVEEFRKLKLYFVQPSDKHIRLWSMQYTKHGIYNFVRRRKSLWEKTLKKGESRSLHYLLFS